MRGWNWERGEWKDGFGMSKWAWVLIALGVVLLLSKLGWSWWWLLMFWWIVPAFFGGWGRWGHHGRGWQQWKSHGREAWARGWHGDEEMTKEKRKNDQMYVYRDDGEVLEVTPTPDKPKRGDDIEYV